MCPSNERRHYNVTLVLTGWAHTQNDPWIWVNLSYKSTTNWKNRIFYGIKHIRILYACAAFYTTINQTMHSLITAKAPPMAISFSPSHPTLALGPFQSWVSSWYEVTPQLHKLTFQTLHLLQLHNFYVQSSREATAKRQYMFSFMHVSPVYFHNKQIHDFHYFNQAGWSQSEFVSDKV